ncbi:g6837 [Coccomyxa elongata]
MEVDFRLYWVRLSHPVAVLASLLLLLRHAIDARNCREICLMPSVVCNLRALICLAAAGLHAYYQYLFWRPGPARLRCAAERAKAKAFVAEIVACLVVAMLAKDPDVSPAADPTLAYALLGWGILLLQVSIESCFHLHALNLLSYLLMEINTVVNMAPGKAFRGGLPAFLWRFTLCTLAPYLAGVLCETCLRRAFLRRHQEVQAGQPGTSTSAAPSSEGIAPLAEKLSEAARDAVSARNARQLVRLACGCLGTCTCGAVA